MDTRRYTCIATRLFFFTCARRFSYFAAVVVFMKHGAFVFLGHFIGSVFGSTLHQNGALHSSVVPLYDGRGTMVTIVACLQRNRCVVIGDGFDRWWWTSSNWTHYTVLAAWATTFWTSPPFSIITLEVAYFLHLTEQLYLDTASDLRVALQVFLCYTLHCLFLLLMVCLLASAGGSTTE